nr:hypothetical protein [Tanacetum cinerariifolium]
MILGIQTTDPTPRPTFDFTAKLFSNMKLNWDGPHMPLLAPMLVVPAGRDAANVATGPGPSSALQLLPEREHSPVPLSPPPSSAEVGPTTSSRPPSPSRPPSGPVDIHEGGGDFASSLPSNEAPQTLAATAAGEAEDSAALIALTLKLDECLHRVTTLENELGITKKVLGGAVLKLVTRVKRLEGRLQQRKRRLVLSDSEGDDATTIEQEFDLAALHTLASATLGDDPFATAAGPDVETTMPDERTSTTRRRLRKPFTSFVSAHVSKTIPPGVCVLVAATTIPAGSSVDAAVHAAAPSSFLPTAADKGKAPMVDNSPPADLLLEHERVLKNLHDSHLGEELAKMIQAEQESEFARQQEELAQKALAESVASPTAHGQRMSDQRRWELDAAQLIYTEADWLDLLAKIATNSALSKQLLGDDVTEENMNEWLGMLLMGSDASWLSRWTMKKVKTLSIDQLRLEFRYQMDMEELDIKWQMAMLSLRINKFQKKAVSNINFNNKDTARFDRRKARCYNCLQLGHFVREYIVKKVDEKARYYAFKISEVKTEEPKAMVSVDFMLNWNEHEAEHKPEDGEQVYGLMAGFKSDFADLAVNAAGSVYDAATEFAMMGIYPKVQTCPFDCDSKLSELKKNYAHLETMYNDSFIQVQANKNTIKTLELQKDWYHKTQLALEEKVRILSANLENTTNTLKYSETLYNQAKIEKKEWEVKLVESLARFDKWKASSKNLAKLINSSMTTRIKLGLGFKEYFGLDEVFDLSTPSTFDPEPVTREELSCRPLSTLFLKKLSPMPADSFSTVDVKILPKSDVKDPSPTNGVSSCSIKESVKPPSDL